jgi:hypothetical protein
VNIHYYFLLNNIYNQNFLFHLEQNKKQFPETQNMIRSSFVPSFIEGLDHNAGEVTIRYPSNMQYEEKISIIDYSVSGPVNDGVLYNTDGSWEIILGGVTGIDANSGRLGFWVKIDDISPYPGDVSWFDIHFSNCFRIGPNNDLDAVVAGSPGRFEYTLFDSDFPQNMDWTFIEYRYDIENGEYSLLMNGIVIYELKNGITDPFSIPHEMSIYAGSGIAQFHWNGILSTNNPNKSLYAVRYLSEYNKNPDPEITLFWRCVGGGTARSAPDFVKSLDYINSVQGRQWPWPYEDTLVNDHPGGLNQPTVKCNKEIIGFSLPTLPYTPGVFDFYTGYDIPKFDMNKGRLGVWVKIKDGEAGDDLQFSIIDTTESDSFVGIRFSADSTSPYVSVAYKFNPIQGTTVRLINDEWTFVEYGWDTTAGIHKIYIDSSNVYTFNVTHRTMTPADHVVLTTIIPSEAGEFYFSNFIISTRNYRDLYPLRNITENPRIGHSVDNTINVDTCNYIKYSPGCVSGIDIAPIIVSRKDVVVEAYPCTYSITRDTDMNVDRKDTSITAYNPSISKSSTISVNLKDIDIKRFNPSVSYTHVSEVDRKDVDIITYEPAISNSHVSAVTRKDINVQTFNLSLINSPVLNVNLKTISVMSYNPRVIIVNQNDIYINVDQKNINIETYNPSKYITSNVSVDRKDVNIQCYNPDIYKSQVTSVDRRDIYITAYNPSTKTDGASSVGLKNVYITPYSCTFQVISHIDVNIDMTTKDIVMTTFDPAISTDDSTDTYFWWRGDHD